MFNLLIFHDYGTLSTINKSGTKAMLRVSRRILNGLNLFHYSKFGDPLQSYAFYKFIIRYSFRLGHKV